MDFQEAGNNCGLTHSCGGMCTTDHILHTFDSSKATVSDYCVISLSPLLNVTFLVTFMYLPGHLLYVIHHKWPKISDQVNFYDF